MEENIKLFINWLNTNGIYDAYIYAWEMDNDLDFSHSFKTWIQDRGVHIPNLIISAFTWDSTEEGQDFWEDYHYRWRCYYKNQKDPSSISIY